MSTVGMCIVIWAATGQLGLLWLIVDLRQRLALERDHVSRLYCRVHRLEESIRIACLPAGDF